TEQLLPLLDYLIYDILCLSGRLLYIPVKFDSALERIWRKYEDEVILVIQVRIRLSYILLKELDCAVKIYFSNSLLIILTKFITL
ncbi:uncharacterized protein BO88DRAFT_352726, partial [Aspergillus vadensis CBS 113365]